MGQKIDIKTLHKKHIKYWHWSLKILRPILSWIYKYEYELAPPIKGNYMVLCNHNSNLDPWLCALSFDEQMYFLAAENMFRLGPVSWLIKTIWAPISKLKGKSDASAIINLMRHIKAGCNVSLFPEGNRSFNGRTGEIFPATGKLVKTSGVSLITFKITGMYFATPRWAKILRRGRTSGKVVGVYSPKYLSTMTPDQINDLIKKDIYEDAYQEQEKHKIIYKSLRKAEGIESALYLCPKCKGLHTLKSKWSSFYCTNCEAKAKFTNYGYIEGDFQFSTITEWDDWQKKELINIANNSNLNLPILQHKNVYLINFDQNHKANTVDSGQLAMYKNRLTVGDTELLFSEIFDMSIVFRKTLLVVMKGNKNYEIKSKQLTSARGYLDLYKIISRLGE